MRTSTRWPAAMVLLAAVCFGTTGTAHALGPDGATPTAVGAVRIVVGGAVLAAVAAVLSRRGPGRRARATPSGVATVVVAAAGVVAYQPLFFAGVASTGVAIGTLIALGSAPVLTGALEWAVLRRPPGPRWAAATAVAAAGVAVLSVGGSGASRLDPVGVLAALGAGASYSVYTLASKRLLEDGWPPERAMGAAFGTAALMMSAVLPFVDLSWLATPSGLATGAFLGLVPTALAYLLFARGLRRLPASEVSTLTLAEPLTAGLLGIVLLGEAVGPLFAVGAGLLVCGLAVLSVRTGNPTSGTAERCDLPTRPCSEP